MTVTASDIAKPEINQGSENKPSLEKPPTKKLEAMKARFGSTALKLKDRILGLKANSPPVDLQDEIDEFRQQEERLQVLNREVAEKTEASSITGQELEVPYESPRELSKQELFQLAKEAIDIQGISKKWRFDESFVEELVEKFVNKSIAGAKVNGVSVVSIDFEHGKKMENTLLESLFTSYLRSPKPKVVVLEYFYPELRKNAAKAGLLSKMEEYEKKKNNAPFGWGERFAAARDFSKQCQEAGKTVAVADIANKVMYRVDGVILRCLPIIAGAAWGLSGVGAEAFYVASPAFLLASAGGFARNHLNEILGKGLYDKDKISKEEKFLLNFEDARRYYIARGIEQLTKDYFPTQEEENPQIVLFYPRAHGLRIINHLIHPGQPAYRIKDFIYRILGHGLDFSVRRWKYNGDKSDESASQQRNSGFTSQIKDLDPENWRLISDKKIPIKFHRTNKAPLRNVKVDHEEQKRKELPKAA